MSDIKKSKASMEFKNTLPAPFIAKLNKKDGMVLVSKPGSKGVSVNPNSIKSISSLLEILLDPSNGRMTTGAPLELVDGFTNKSVRVTFGDLHDIGKVLDGLEILDPLDNSTLAGNEASTHNDAQSAPEDSKQIVDVIASEQVAQPTVKRRGRPKAVVAPVVEAKEKMPKPAKQSASQKTDTKTSVEAPSWYRDNFKFSYNGNGASGTAFRVVKVAMQLKDVGSDEVLGIEYDPKKIMAWGFEIVSGMTHVGWVIAQAENQLLISGMENASGDGQPFTSIDGLVASLSTAL